jgi:hypothetical protein
MFYFLFSGGGKVIRYVVLCPTEGCNVFLLLGSCSSSVVLFVLSVVW